MIDLFGRKTIRLAEREAQSLREASLQLAARLEEVAAERNSWRDKANEWEKRYIEFRDQHDEDLKRPADWIAIHTSGNTMFDKVHPAPAPPIDYSKMPAGPRLARDLIAEKTRENYMKAMASIGLTGGKPQDPSIAATADDLMAEFKREQDEYLAKQAG